MTLTKVDGDDGLRLYKINEYNSYTHGYEPCEQNRSNILLPKSTQITIGNKNYIFDNFFVLTDKDLPLKYLYKYDTISFYTRLTLKSQMSLCYLLELPFEGTYNFENKKVKERMESILWLSEYMFGTLLCLRNDIIRSLNCLQHLNKKVTWCKNDHEKEIFFIPCFRLENDISGENFLNINNITKYFTHFDANIKVAKEFRQELKKEEKNNNDNKKDESKLNHLSSYLESVKSRGLLEKDGIEDEDVSECCGEVLYDILEDSMFRLDNFYWDFSSFKNLCERNGIRNLEEEPILHNIRVVFEKDENERALLDSDGDDFDLDVHYNSGYYDESVANHGNSECEDFDLIDEEEEEEEEEGELIGYRTGIKIDKKIFKSKKKVSGREETFHLPSFVFHTGVSSDFVESLISIFHILKFFQFSFYIKPFESVLNHTFNSKFLLLQALMHNTFFPETFHVQTEFYHERRRRIGLPYQGSNMKLNQEKEEHFWNEVVDPELRRTHKRLKQASLAVVGNPLWQFAIVSSCFFVFRESNEDSITDIKSYLMSKFVLNKLYHFLGLGSFVLYGSNKVLSNTTNKERIYANVALSILGAVFLDSGRLAPLRSLLPKFLLSSSSSNNNNHFSLSTSNNNAQNKESLLEGREKDRELDNTLLEKFWFFFGTSRAPAFSNERFRFSKSLKEKVLRVEEKLSVKFIDKEILLRAITHGSMEGSDRTRNSFAGKKSRSKYKSESKSKVGNYERLELLGDSILEFLVTLRLFETIKSVNEEKIQNEKIARVQNSTLFKVMKKLELVEEIRAYEKEGENAYGSFHSFHTNKRKNVNGVSSISNCDHNYSNHIEKKNLITYGEKIYADVFEAIIGAIYIDKNLNECKKIIEKYIFNDKDLGIKKKIKKLKINNCNYKNRLQEVEVNLINKNILKENLVYLVEKEDENNMEKRFQIGVYYKDRVFGRGLGKTKIEAEKKAAEEAIDNIVKVYVDV